MLTNGELFAGISGFGLGFESAGIKTVWRVEIDRDCQRLLKSRYPDDLLLSDVRECGKHNLPPVDIISFGSPCQDLSVAGKRNGLKGERSGLFHEAIRIISELKPTFAVWENVPGVFSSNAGRDFATVLTSFRECGARDIAWRTLDARYFGVAQRRRRVFLVADFTGERAAEILFESEGMSRDSAESGEAREGIAATIGASPPSSHNGGSNPTPGDFVVTATLSANHGGLANELDFCIPTIARNTGAGFYSEDDKASVRAQMGGTSFDLVARSLTSRNQRNDLETENFVTAFAWQQGATAKGRERIVRAGDYAGSISGSRVDAIAFQQNQREEVRSLGEQAGAIAAEPGVHQQNYVAWHENKGGSFTADDTAKALRAGASHSYQGIGVRRLTPTECERLQGFEDGWTEGFSDSTRYRMLGNAVCVAVSRWIAHRIAGVANVS